MRKDFHQIRQVELTTNQLLLAQACVSAAMAEVNEYNKKIERGEVEAEEWAREENQRSLEELSLLGKAFRSAMRDIENTWGEES